MGRTITEVTKVEESLEVPVSFQAIHDEINNTVTFDLINGKTVVIKEPSTKQILLLEGFIKSHTEEYRTDAFIMLAIASYSIVKYGDRNKITFDELLDELELDDMERLATAMSHFQSFFSKLTKWIDSKGSK